MPRKARIVLANCPHHIIQRGHNRMGVFAKDRGVKRGQIYFLLCPTSVQEAYAMHGIPAKSQSVAGAGAPDKARYSVCLE